MSASLDEVRHIKETAVHTHWCSFQQTTKWICIIVASISRIDWVRHHLLHRESHQAVIMEIFKEHHGLLKNLGIGELTDDTIQSSETCVCRIYNVHRTDSIDAARHLLFSKTGKPAAMTPTSDVLRFHLKRVHYQSMIWRNAHCPTPELPAPSEMGWRLVDSELQPVLMTLSPIPNSCLEMVTCSCRKQCKTRRCKCQKSGLRCTSMCACQHQTDDHTVCMNRHS